MTVARESLLTVVRYLIICHRVVELGRTAATIGSGHIVLQALDQVQVNMNLIMEACLPIQKAIADMEPQAKCDQCDKICLTAQGLATHKRFIHPKMKKCKTSLDTLQRVQSWLHVAEAAPEDGSMKRKKTDKYQASPDTVQRVQSWLHLAEAAGGLSAPEDDMMKWKRRKLDSPLCRSSPAKEMENDADGPSDDTLSDSL